MGVILMAEILYTSDTPREWKGYPGNKTLRARIIAHQKRTNAKELRQMTHDGRLDQYVETQIAAIQKRAQRLIGDGEIPTHAWRRAERIFIYGKDED